METSISQMQLRGQGCSPCVRTSNRAIESCIKPVAAEPHKCVFHLGLPKAAQ